MPTSGADDEVELWIEMLAVRAEQNVVLYAPWPIDLLSCLVRI